MGLGAKKTYYNQSARSRKGGLTIDLIKAYELETKAAIA
jgi:hypothetical protein